MGRVITSRDNAVIKALRALVGDPREIRRQGRTVIDGPHLLESYRRRMGAPAMIVVGASAVARPEVSALLAACPEVAPLTVADGVFRELSGVATPVGILGVIDIPREPTGAVVGTCVMLDAVQDAGNVGAILRTAAAAGVADVLLGPGCAGVWTPRVLRAAQGAHFSLRLREGVELPTAVGAYPGASLAAMAGEGESIFDLNLSGDIAWIFGNEGSGIARPLADMATGRVTIPLARSTESLNVAAAAAVCLFEARRQQHLQRRKRDENDRP
ncbi:MAG: RNA methyltransferase [Rhodocyclaceae bacterium]|nr:RNA methyltransferase [Rhodocyclaceae bacterium]MBK9311557.1 RNA methyltransferase [Rhodocyclaceae bacterium]